MNQHLENTQISRVIYIQYLKDEVARIKESNKKAKVHFVNTHKMSKSAKCKRLLVALNPNSKVLDFDKKYIDDAYNETIKKSDFYQRRLKYLNHVRTLLMTIEAVEDIYITVRLDLYKKILGKKDD